jgi:hypothetical protein
MQTFNRKTRLRRTRPAISTAVAFVLGTAMFGFSTMIAAFTLI